MVKKIRLKRLKPQFFDIFGVLGFAVIILASVFIILDNESYHSGIYAILFIGIVGIMVDINVVFKHYIKEKLESINI
jgi:hypothetical protein